MGRCNNLFNDRKCTKTNMLFWAQFWMSIGSPIIIQLRNTLLWTFRKSRIESVSCGIELPQVSENRGIRSALDGTWMAVTYLFRTLKVVCNIRFCSGRVVRKTAIKRPLDANKSNCIHESGAIGSKWNKFFEFRVFTVSVGTQPLPLQDIMGNFTCEQTLWTCWTEINSWRQRRAL